MININEDEKDKYRVTWSNKFKKDYKLSMKRGLPIEELDAVIKMLKKGDPLPENYNDHELVGNWKNHRECHIRPDWLLIYQIKDDILVLELTRTGSHSDLF
ncbi:MAG: type II toxin-antitoxin system YafQ family toxin [Clostridia bacterium]|nr:type II toxin-antitoxin system YafQ family toxin [Clostridia bacterium]